LICGPSAQRLKPHAIDIRVDIDLKNAYRVLLTRARQGMVIFVPPGAKRDRTQSLSRNLSHIRWAQRSLSA
jgi:hypothetical protein